MFIGRGFDTDGDGGSDIFIGGPVNPQGMGCALLLCIAVAAVAVVMADEGMADYRQGVVSYFKWFAVVLGGVVGLCLVLAATTSICDRYDLNKGMAYTVITAVAFSCLGVRACVVSTGEAKRKQQQEAAATQAEQERLNAEQQENLRKIFNTAK